MWCPEAGAAVCYLIVIFPAAFSQVKGQRYLLNRKLCRFWNWFGGFRAQKTHVVAVMNGNTDPSGTIPSSLSGFPRYRNIAYDVYILRMDRGIKEKKTYAYSLRK